MFTGSSSSAEAGFPESVKEMERVARILLVIGVPRGFIPEGIKDYRKSIWKPKEFINRGYKVEFFGSRFLLRLALRKMGTPCSKFIFSIDPFTHIVNNIQIIKPHYMIAYKQF